MQIQERGVKLKTCIGKIKNSKIGKETECRLTNDFTNT